MVHGRKQCTAASRHLGNDNKNHRCPSLPSTTGGVTSLTYVYRRDFLWALVYCREGGLVLSASVRFIQTHTAADCGRGLTDDNAPLAPIRNVGDISYHSIAVVHLYDSGRREASIKRSIRDEVSVPIGSHRLFGWNTDVSDTERHLRRKLTPNGAVKLLFLIVPFPHSFQSNFRYCCPAVCHQTRCALFIGDTFQTRRYQGDVKLRIRGLIPVSDCACVSS